MTETARRGARLGRVELIALLALSIALPALGIDILLPALSTIRVELGLPADSTAVAGLVTAYLLGLAGGQLIYGPLADRFGRRPILYLGYGVYASAALLATLAPTLPLLLAARFVWGLGAAGPRVITIAIVRDTFEGDRMARAMSFVMAVFLLVPVIAPTLGAAIVAVASWRWVFGAAALVAGLIALWAIRLPETLRPEHRLELRLGRVLTAARYVATDRLAVGYTLAMSVLFGAFMSWIASSELIVATVFDRADQFPYIFGGLAATMGLGMVLNSQLVSRIGTRRLAHVVLLIYLAVVGLLLAVVIAHAGRPPLAAFLPIMAALLVCHAVLIPNFNTLAMTNMAPVAGTASSLIGATQVAGGASLGALLDRTFDGTLLPLSLGFVGFTLVSVSLVLWTERGRLFQPMEKLAPPVPPGHVTEG